MVSLENEVGIEQRKRREKRIMNEERKEKKKFIDEEKIAIF